MWKAILILILVVVFTIVVVPLAYITLGKVKGAATLPVATKNGTAVPVFGQNYIPEASGVSDASSTNPGGFNLALEGTCEEEETVMLKEDIISHLALPENRQYIESKNFNFTWNLAGAWQEASVSSGLRAAYPIFISGGKSPETTLASYMRAGKYTSAECTAYYEKMYGYMQDSGRYVSVFGSKLGWDSTLSILEKGKMNINGGAYYWYIFQDGRLSYTDNGQKFLASFNTYNNGIMYSVNFLGSKEKNGSYRKMFTIAAEYVAGLRI